MNFGNIFKKNKIEKEGVNTSMEEVIFDGEIDKKYNKKNPDKNNEDVIEGSIFFALAAIKTQMLKDRESKKKYSGLSKDLFEKITTKPLIHLLSQNAEEKHVISALDDLFPDSDEKRKPTEYISVKSGPINYLKNLESGYGNIMISELHTRPLNPNNDIYRYELLKEINRVIPIGGYFIEASSFPTFYIITKEGRLKEVSITDFGFEKVVDIEHDKEDGLYRKERNISDLEISRYMLEVA